MSEFNDFNSNTGDVVTGVDTVKKGKGGLIAGVVAGVTAGAVAVVAGGGVLAYNLSDFVKNQVKLRFSKPANYYAWVNEKNADSAAKEIAESYRKSLDMAQEGQKSKVSLQYEITDEVKDLMLEDLFYFDESDVGDVIRNMDSITIGADTEVNNNIISGSVYADLNNDRLITMDIASDTSAMEFFMRVPELTEKWLGVETGDVLEDSIYYDEDEKDILEAYKRAMQDPGSILSPEEIETEAARYIKVWNESVDDVKLDKKETITINDIDVNYAVVTVELTEQKAEEIAKNFINAAKEDEILKSIVVDRLGIATGKEYNEALDELLEEFEHDEDYEYSTDTAKISTYIDARGDIRGFGIEGDDEDESLLMIVGKDGDKVRGEFSFYDGISEPEFVLTLTADANGDKYSGNFDFLVDDETYTLEFTDFEIVDEKYGYFNADVTLVIPDTDPIGLTFTSDGKSQSVAGNIKYEGKDYGRLTLTVGAQSGAEPKLPSKDSAFMIDDAYDISIEDYVSQEDMEKFIRELLEKIGFSKELSEEGAKNWVDDIYNPYSFGYDDWDDDFDWDEWDDDDWDDDDWDYDDDLDFDWDDWNDPYEADAVDPEDRQAYVFVADEEFNAYFIGWGGDPLSYNAKVADIKGNGTYTVSVTADTEGYRRLNDELPKGIGILGIEASGFNDTEGAEIIVKSVKIDGKDYPLSGTAYYECYSDEIAAFVYGGEDFQIDEITNVIDGASVGEWTTIEITFEVKGLKG